jgi:hypothetical protein
VCGTPFEAKRPNARYCSDRCRQRRHRAPEIPDAPPAAADEPPRVELLAVVRRELEAVDRLDTLAGQQALIMARNVDAAPAGTTIVSSLMKEFRATWAEAMRGVPVPGDPVDEIRARRDRKLATG